MSFCTSAVEIWSNYQKLSCMVIIKRNFFKYSYNDKIILLSNYFTSIYWLIFCRWTCRILPIRHELFPSPPRCLYGRKSSILSRRCHDESTSSISSFASCGHGPAGSWRRKFLASLSTPEVIATASSGASLWQRGKVSICRIMKIVYLNQWWINVVWKMGFG